MRGALLVLSAYGPGFIEPNLLRTTRRKLSIPRLPPALQGLRILQFSDLHLHARTPSSFLKRLKDRISQLNPDIILFTGDFLCYGQLKEGDRLLEFLQDIRAPYGCFTIFGNHDYDNFVSVSEEGNYDVLDPSASSLGRGLKKNF